MKKTIRFAARLDIKGDTLIKSIQLEGVQVVGDPRESAQRYYRDGADEILLVDAVASLYGRNHLSEIIRYVAENVFIPITVAGGLRSLQDVEDVLKNGADRVGINTAAVSNPGLITEIAKRFGAQCMVLQIDAKRKGPDSLEVYVDGGREPTGLDVVEWARQATDRGAGEILLTAVNREGTRRGFDIDLCHRVSHAVTVPVIASGGMGSVSDAVAAVHRGGVDAVAMADILHIQREHLGKIKIDAGKCGVSVRVI